MKKVIVIHSDVGLRQDNFSIRWEKELLKRDVVVVKLNFKSSGIVDKIRKLKCDGVMWHWYHSPEDKQIAPIVLTVIERYLNIPVFPNFKTSWHYDEKNAQHYLFDAIKVSKVPSWVFWSYEEAADFLKSADYPLVFKLSVGAGSANVVKVDSEEEAVKFAKIMFYKGMYPYSFNEFLIIGLKDKVVVFSKKIFNAIRGRYCGPSYFLLQKGYVYLQKFIPNNDWDLRVTVVGNRAFGFIRHNRPGDFRASGGGGNDVSPSNIPLDAIKIAHDISKKHGFQSMAYDFLKDESGGVILNEISYCYANSVIRECPGYWDSNLRWKNRQMWPEEAHVEDFLAEIQRK